MERRQKSLKAVVCGWIALLITSLVGVSAEKEWY